jgi:TonB family protein
MGSNRVVRGSVLLFAAVIFSAPALLAAPCTRNDPHATAAGTQTGETALAAYPESAEGLENLLQNWLAAIKVGDRAKSAQFLECFAIPDHATWFENIFGPMEGARLAAKYEALQAQDMDWLRKRGEQVVKQDKLAVVVAIYAKPGDTRSLLQQAVLNAEMQPAALYHTSSRAGANDSSPYFLGYFVYVDGGFRYFEQQVMQALSSAPPLRIAIGGNVQAARLINRVQPSYPEEASKEKISGTVKLHVIIAKDGKIQQIQIVSGHPLLVQAAMDAVRQWQYQPTLLNGQPVEVDTQIDVVFSL